MPGKYAGVLDRLPRYEDPNKSYGDKVNDRKSEMLAPSTEPGPTDDALFTDVELFVREGLKQLMTAAFQPRS